MPQKDQTAMSPTEKAVANPGSKTAAIAAFCYHSCFSEERPNSHATKLQIRDCKRTSCELWPHRGWQTMTGGSVGPRSQREQTTEKTDEV